MPTDITHVLQSLEGNINPDWSQVLGKILTAFDCPTGTLHRLDPDSQLLKLVTQQGLPETILPIVSNIPIGKGMAGICAERQAPVQTCNLQTDSTGVVRPGAKETKMAGAMTVPILHDGKLLGTLGIAKPVAYDFSEEETKALTAISDQIGSAWA